MGTICGIIWKIVSNVGGVSDRSSEQWTVMTLFRFTNKGTRYHVQGHIHESKFGTG